VDLERWRRVLDLFELSVDVDAGRRAAVLDEASGGDGELRDAIESMLASEPEARGFLTTPVLDVCALQNGDDCASDLVGEEVGPYRIKTFMARGGMGLVYEAVQQEPPRTVALKLMRRGVASRSAQRRFRREAQILARLHHPGIARVYESGMHDSPDGGGGVPFFTMEYISQASTIVEYATANVLSSMQRLALFATACDAIQYGHSNGIIHCDLKPGNILVDSSGRPRIIDFGVARTTASDQDFTTQHTDVGDLIGTLQYMSPEQCDADSHDLDVRSDVYSLGVVLYELLTGQLPYTTSRSTVSHAVRTIKESVPRRLSKIDDRLGGDIETIVLTALEKDLTRRFQSVAELARDIRRYLNAEPIAAQPPSLTYRLAKLVSRRKWQVISAAAESLALMGTVVVAAVSHVWLKHALRGSPQ